MIINRVYIDYNDTLIKEGYFDLVLKGLNRISLTGYADNNIRLDLISLKHYINIIGEFDKMYTELYNKVENLVCIYLVGNVNKEDTYLLTSSDNQHIVTSDDFVLQSNNSRDYILISSDNSTLISSDNLFLQGYTPPLEDFLVGSEGEYLIDIEADVKDLVLKYGDFDTNIKYIDVISNYENNGFISNSTSYVRGSYLQDDILSYYNSVDEELLKSYNCAIKYSIEILIKYNSLKR